MAKSNQEKNDHPAIEGPGFLAGILQLDAETHSEQKGKKSVKLTVNQESLDRPSDLVGHSPGGRIRECPKRELREIGQAYSQNGEPSEGIEHNVSFLFHNPANFVNNCYF